MVTTDEQERQGREEEAAAVVPRKKPRQRRTFLLALGFLAPAALLLGALVVYPIVFTIVRSLYSPSGARFVGVDNYEAMFESDRTVRAIRNNLIWVVVAPTLATGIGLVLAVLAERVRWQTAFKVAVFMPMAISFLAAGVIFRIVYEEDPRRGLANAVVTEVADTVRPPGQYARAIASDTGSGAGRRRLLRHHRALPPRRHRHARARRDPTGLGARGREAGTRSAGAGRRDRRRRVARLHAGRRR